MESVLPLEEVTRRLERAGVTWAVFAGAAASVYGADRPLTDVDILVSLAQGTQVACLFPGAEVKRQEDGCVRSVKLPDVDIIAGLTMFEGDVAYDVDLDPEMAARRTYHEIVGVRVPVIPREDNVLLKAVWGRGLEQGKHDWEDVRAMIAHGEIDWGYLQWRADACGAVQSVRQALQRIAALAEEEKG